MSQLYQNSFKGLVSSQFVDSLKPKNHFNGNNSNQNSQFDHYNYPSMNRKDLMSLQTINSSESGFFNMKNDTIRDQNLNINDIRGAQPKIRAQQLIKPDSHNVGDIQGSQSKPLIQYRQQNKESHILGNFDIAGSFPNINKFQTKRQAFNPLEPSYCLSSAEQILQEPTKFLRDTLQIQDIEGARAKKHGFLAYDKKYEEIEGTKSRKLFIPQDSYDSLNVKDINNKKRVEQSIGIKDPLNPTYTWRISEEKVNTDTIGYIEGSNPRILHNHVHLPYDKQNNSDIKGASAGSLVKRYNKNNRYAYSNLDIEGTQANSKKIGIQTKRQTDPLKPQYQILGRTETDNVFGGFQFSQNKQIPTRSSLAASASQNLIRRNTGSSIKLQKQLNSPSNNPTISPSEQKEFFDSLTNPPPNYSNPFASLSDKLGHQKKEQKPITSLFNPLKQYEIITPEKKEPYAQLKLAIESIQMIDNNQSFPLNNNEYTSNKINNQRIHPLLNPSKKHDPILTQIDIVEELKCQKSKIILQNKQFQEKRESKSAKKQSVFDLNKSKINNPKSPSNQDSYASNQQKPDLIIPVSSLYEKVNLQNQRKYVNYQSDKSNVSVNSSQNQLLISHMNKPREQTTTQDKIGEKLIQQVLKDKQGFLSELKQDSSTEVKDDQELDELIESCEFLTKENQQLRRILHEQEEVILKMNSIIFDKSNNHENTSDLLQVNQQLQIKLSQVELLAEKRRNQMEREKEDLVKLNGNPIQSHIIHTKATFQEQQNIIQRLTDQLQKEKQIRISEKTFEEKPIIISNFCLGGVKIDDLPALFKGEESTQWKEKVKSIVIENENFKIALKDSAKEIILWKERYRNLEAVHTAVLSQQTPQINSNEQSQLLIFATDQIKQDSHSEYSIELRQRLEELILVTKEQCCEIQILKINLEQKLQEANELRIIVEAKLNESSKLKNQINELQEQTIQDASAKGELKANLNQMQQLFENQKSEIDHLYFLIKSRNIDSDYNLKQLDNNLMQARLQQVTIEQYEKELESLIVKNQTLSEQMYSIIISQQAQDGWLNTTMSNTAETALTTSELKPIKYNEALLQVQSSAKMNFTSLIPFSIFPNSQSYCEKDYLNLSKNDEVIKLSQVQVNNNSDQQPILNNSALNKLTSCDFDFSKSKQDPSLILNNQPFQQEKSIFFSE